jgi:hypothetical protein
MRSRIEIIKTVTIDNEYQKIFGEEVAEVITRTKTWGVQKQLFSFDGFQKAIEGLELEQYETKHSRIGPVVNATTFGSNIKKLIRTCSFNYSQAIDNEQLKGDDFMHLMRKSLVLPIRVIIDWLLDESKKIRFIPETNCFVTINRDGQMLENFELMSLEEADQKGSDVAYEIIDIDNVRINPKTSKEQFRVEFAPINGKKYRKQWCNDSMLDAPLFKSKVKRLQTKAINDHEGLLPKSSRRPFSNNKYILNDKLYN